MVQCGSFLAYYRYFVSYRIVSYFERAFKYLKWPWRLPKVTNVLSVTCVAWRGRWWWRCLWTVSMPSIYHAVWLQRYRRCVTVASVHRTWKPCFQRIRFPATIQWSRYTSSADLVLITSSLIHCQQHHHHDHCKIWLFSVAAPRLRNQLPCRQSWNCVNRQHCSGASLKHFSSPHHTECLKTTFELCDAPSVNL